MFKRQKPIGEQVVVITGGTSGIGLETARLAGRKGAHIVIAARSAEGLRKASAALTQAGIQVETVEADVGERDDVERIGAPPRSSASDASTPGSTMPVRRSTAVSTRSVNAISGP